MQFSYIYTVYMERNSYGTKKSIPAHFESHKPTEPYECNFRE